MLVMVVFVCLIIESSGESDLASNEKARGSMASTLEMGM